MREKCIVIKPVCKELVKMINYVISVEQQEKWRQLCRFIGWSITEIDELVQWVIWTNELEEEEEKFPKDILSLLWNNLFFKKSCLDGFLASLYFILLFSPSVIVNKSTVVK